MRAGTTNEKGRCAGIFHLIVRILTLPPIVIGITVLLMYAPAKLMTLRELLLCELFLLLIPMAAYPIREIFHIGKDRRKGQRSTALVCSAIGYPQIQRPCFLGSRDRIDSIQNRQQQEKILQKSADKHLFQCYRVKHGRKSCR